MYLFFRYIESNTGGGGVQDREFSDGKISIVLLPGLPS